MEEEFEQRSPFEVEIKDIQFIEVFSVDENYSGYVSLSRSVELTLFKDEERQRMSLMFPSQVFIHQFLLYINPQPFFIRLPNT